MYEAPKPSWEEVRDGSDEAMTSEQELDMCNYGRDYEPLPMFVMKSKHWPQEEAADDFADSYKAVGRGAQAPDTHGE